MNLNALVHSSQLISNLQTNKYSMDRGNIVPVLKKKSFCASSPTPQSASNVCVVFHAHEKKS